jgi:hypothetical protein
VQVPTDGREDFFEHPRVEKNVGPVSKRNPDSSMAEHRPPGRFIRSRTVT